MKIAVIAAQGKSGQAFVHAALNAGHVVRAGVRGRAPFDAHERLELVECDALDSSQVTKLIKGSDAVVSLIGHVKGSSSNLQTVATQNAIEAMQTMGIKRFVSLTGTGARAKGDTPSRVDKILNMLVEKVDPHRIADGKAHVEILQASKLHWTVLRVLKLTRGKAHKYSLTMHGPAKLLTPRKEVAQAILQVLSSDEYIRTQPVITSLRS